MSSAAAAADRAFGVDRGLPFPLEDIAQTAVVLLAGGNPAETMPPVMQYFAAMQARGLTNAEQLTAIAASSQEFGTGSVDITTRQQVQVRGFAIEHVPEIWNRLERVGLVSLQTGMDNIRNVVGCTVAGLAWRAVDASPVVHEFTQMFLRNKAFTNLPRKFNVNISGCTEHCTHAEFQDLALTPAIKEVAGRRVSRRCPLPP
jgi:sulfite reductase beta subunit-like hemoprotein